MVQIIGAGAIGCLWLAKLQQQGYPCHIVSRSSPTSNTLFFTDNENQQFSFKVSHSQRLLNDTQMHRQSIILVCVKAMQVLPALLEQRQYINSNQTIVLMHNGFGCAELVEENFPNNTIVCATTANGSLLNAKLDITHTGAGPSYFGLFKPESLNNLKQQKILEQINCLLKAMPNSYWVNNIIDKCWLKLIINALINPLTAIHQVRNGQLEHSPHNALFQPLLIEVCEIAEAEQQIFEFSDLEQIVNDVIKATANNYSSMNRDIFYHRQTEIDFINGYLIEKARQHNIDTPILKDLYKQIKRLEAREASPEHTR
jgi:2-dehydropantoate 2-reductase